MQIVLVFLLASHSSSFFMNHSPSLPVPTLLLQPSTYLHPFNIRSAFAKSYGKTRVGRSIRRRRINRHSTFPACQAQVCSLGVDLMRLSPRGETLAVKPKRPDTSQLKVQP